MLEADVIIPVWKLTTDRRNNLQNAYKFWDSQQCAKAHINVVNPDTKEFNKQWQCNLGVRQSKTNKIIIADADIVYHSDSYLSEFMNWIEYHKLRWAFGWTRVLYQAKDGGRPVRDDWPEPGINEGCIVYFEKALWEEMGGANEWVRELRGPDNEIALKARFLTGTHIGFPVTLTHRWHPPSQMKHTQYRENNKEILKYTRKRPREVIDILKRQDWGSADGSYCTKKSFYEARMGI